MARKLRATPPPFTAKPKPAPKVKKSRDQSRAVGHKTRAKEIPAPVESPVKLALRVTAGPYFDDRHPRSHEAWVVITRQGDLVTYHRFRSEADAKAFVKGLDNS